MFEGTGVSGEKMSQAVACFTIQENCQSDLAEV